MDISETGCFVEYEGELPADAGVMVEIDCNGIEIRCLGQVVNRFSKASETHTQYQGYGIKFQAVPKEMKKESGNCSGTSKDWG